MPNFSQKCSFKLIIFCVSRTTSILDSIFFVGEHDAGNGGTAWQQRDVLLLTIMIVALPNCAHHVEEKQESGDNDNNRQREHPPDVQLKRRIYLKKFRWVIVFVCEGKTFAYKKSLINSLDWISLYQPQMARLAIILLAVI